MHFFFLGHFQNSVDKILRKSKCPETLAWIKWFFFIFFIQFGLYFLCSLIRYSDWRFANGWHRSFM